MTQAERKTKPGEAKLKHLFEPGRIGRFATRNRCSIATEVSRTIGTGDHA